MCDPAAAALQLVSVSVKLVQWTVIDWKFIVFTQETRKNQVAKQINPRNLGKESDVKKINLENPRKNQVV